MPDLSPADHRRPTAEMPDRIAGKTYPEIMALFRWLGYTDRLGHELVNCVDFMRLAERAAGGKEGE